MNAAAPHPLDRVLNPRSIAVIGASKDPAKRGYRAILSLQADGYTGAIVPINPREREILGLPAYPSIAEAPGEIDLAIVCTAAATTPDVIEACGRRGVKGAILLAAGFSEAGEEGRLLEERTLAVARRHKVRLIGPNTNGMFSAPLRCNAWGLPDIPVGPLALLSNSANVVTSLVLQARVHGHMGIHTMLSVGNQADILFHEYLECLAGDADVGAVMMYLEGFKDARRFAQAARHATPRKPVVMYVAGRTGEGKRAAKSHSGSLAGAYPVNRDVLRQAGVTVVERLYHLYPVSEALSLFPPMRGRRVAVLSEGGGPITVAADALVEAGLELAPLSEATQALIHSVVPAATAIANPVDAGGGTDPRADYYRPIARAILEDPNVDALLIVGIWGGYAERFSVSASADEEPVSRLLGEWMREHGKPVIVQSHFADLKTQALGVLRAAGVPYQRHVEVAVQCLASAAERSAALGRLDAAGSATGQLPEALAAPAQAVAIVATARAEGRHLLEPEARDLLGLHGVPVPAHRMVTSASEAAATATAFGDPPLAMKVVSRDIVHKSEAGGVQLRLRGAEALAEAFATIRERALQWQPDARIAGCLVTPMAAPGVEMIVGVVRDAQHGPVVLVGLGGVLVEQIGDVAFRAPPLARDEALAMLDQLRFRALLDGVRGAAAIDRGAIADLIVAVARIAIAHPEIVEIDLNPVIAHAEGCTLVDARMLLEGGR